jgi:PAS domain S-box-containing protein
LDFGFAPAFQFPERNFFDKEIFPVKQAVEALTRLADSARDLIFVINHELRIEYANCSVPNSFVFHPQQVIGKPLYALFPQNGNKSLTEALKILFENGGPVSSESSIWWPESETWFETSFTPIRDQRGVVCAAFGIGRDVTERKAREELIARSRREWLRAVDTMPYLLAVVDEQYRFEGGQHGHGAKAGGLGAGGRGANLP